MSNISNNRRIVKNTLFLYFRMVLTLGVTLYTSRVVLNSLGVEDFGIYNVVGGVVTMMAFLSGAMSSATQRFFSFELGQNNLEQLAKVFKMSLSIHWLIILMMVLLAQTLGLWFVNTHLVIPPERLIAANWVFQCALFSFCCTVLGVPYNAAIIAHERMSAFAYISIIDVLLKLTVVFLLAEHCGDRLQFYALLMVAVSLLTLGCYYIYARRQFAVTRFSLYWDATLFKILLSYTGWNLFGNLAVVMSNQGINILLNIFFGAHVNAARAIAIQVSGAISGFVNSLQMSINPQIIKAYAVEDMLYMHKLVFAGARYTFYFMLLLSSPVFMETQVILELWLGDVPRYTSFFVQLVLIESCLICLSGTLMTSAQATGNIKLYQVVVGGLQLCNLPVAYLLLKINKTPLVVFYVSIFMIILSFVVRLLFMKKLINLTISEYIKNVLVLSSRVILVVVVVNFSIGYLFFDVFLDDNLHVLIKIIIYLITTSAIIYWIGLRAEEKSFINKLVLKVISR
ncbi:lipopolysaccharide biosynthesis protein [Aeromonas sp. S16(2024)]|uniref:lipopolysaccharide biosynthesis protein n=1 Tax=Aeromonas sp. S16(2024) TaxID=3242889 RepID=UPI0035275DD1